MAGGITIRPAGPADAEGITRIYMESAEHHARLEPDRYHVPNRDYIVARYGEQRQGPDSTTIVAVADGTVVGFLDARLDRSLDPMHRDFVFCYIAEIAVASTHQSRGIGEQLIRAAEQWGRENSAEYAMLEYLSCNTRAASFYHDRMGYRIASILAAKPLK